jgi:hypothetical protein
LLCSFEVYLHWMMNFVRVLYASLKWDFGFIIMKTRIGPLTTS